MKTKFKLLMWVAMLLSACTGYSQCSAVILSQPSGPGTLLLQDSAELYVYQDSTTSIQLVWSFGDGTDTTLVNEPGVYHTYTTSGKYNVCLTVIDTARHCTVQQCDTETINLCAEAAQNISITPIAFGVDTFVINYPSAGFNIRWGFGDGNWAGGFDTVHQYATSGNYTVELGIYGPGCGDTVTQPLTVNICQPYNLGFTVRNLSINPYTAEVVANNQNGAYNYNWTYTDGAYGQSYIAGSLTGYSQGASGLGVDSSLYNVNYGNGLSTIFLMISDPVTGCADTSWQTITVDRCGLGATAYENSNGLVVNYGAWVIIDSTQVGSVSYQWNFAGISPATSTNAYNTITYPALGSYTAALFISTQGGCTDTFNFAFTLTPGVYNINGVVDVGNGNGLTTVYLIKQDSVGHLALVDSTVVTVYIDSSGNNQNGYSFNTLPADTYYVKAALNSGSPGYADYLPTYYTNALSWVSATPVIITTGDQNGIDITLTPGTNPGGPGFVSGYVSQGAGLVLQQGGGNVTRGVGDALAGVQINLLTSADEAVAYTFTDVNGQYHFSNLPYGSYKINAEELNKRPAPIPFTLSPSDSAINNLNLSINSDSSYATAITDVNNISIQGIYPNPVVNTLQIQLSSTQQADATVKMIDILGNTIQAGTTRLNTGANHLQVNMESLAAGVYQLLIQTNNTHLTYKVVKAN